MSVERARAAADLILSSRTRAVKFDVWLGDGTPFGEVIQVASVILPAFSGGKWYYAGFFNVEQYRVDCDGPLQRRQLTGLEMCITWQTTGQLVEDPRGLDQYPVRLVLADSSSTAGVCVCLFVCLCVFVCQPFSSNQVYLEPLDPDRDY
jgi:hypothetical protein